MSIGVFFGGKSPEHEVSIITGQLILSELKKIGHTVVPVYIDKNGLWKSQPEMAELNFFTNPALEANLKKLSDINWVKIGGGGLELQENKFVGKRYKIDMAFPALHGSFGEDGSLQGLFELADLPYVGCEVTPSAIAIDKILTKQVLQSLGIPTPKFKVITKTEWAGKRQVKLLESIEELNWPIVVKPPRLGSSIGVQKVNDLQSLEIAVEVALKYGQEVLLEKAVPNLKDLTCCVIGNHDLEVSLVQESKFGEAIFSYDEKYLKEGGTQFGAAKTGLQIPAEIPDEVTGRIQELSKKIFQNLGCTGIARVDFLLDQSTQELFTIEVNPLPGTLYHHLWKESGKTLRELVSQLISLADERYKEKKSQISSFPSNLLKFAGSKKLQIKDG